MCLRLALSAITFVVAVGPGWAAQKQVRPIGLVILSGTCTKLIVNGKDQTSECGNKILNTDYSDSRTGFYFTTNSDLILTLSGIGDRQVKLDANNVVMPIDMVILGLKEQNDPVTVVGTCKFANPYLGPVLVTCKAEGALGTFEGSFMTDGSKPNRKVF